MKALSFTFCSKLLTVFLFNLFLRGVAFMNRKKNACELSKSHTAVVWIYHSGGDLGKIFALLITSNKMDVY